MRGAGAYPLSITRAATSSVFEEIDQWLLYFYCSRARGNGLGHVSEAVIKKKQIGGNEPSMVID